ncbi:hypothetical protein J2Z22_001717 [Paenibacillus forsythiae]|uniref:MBL fold metallo-hydrolase n=1 Tax=Paenibacillus forsythiae TaxID=365616 RepID=A0ABU3H858_9BACL|nr:hypothetical protein [Paenibacillus forsythiae]
MYESVTCVILESFGDKRITFVDTLGPAVI